MRHRQAGFTYAMVLVAVVLVGIVAETGQLTMSRVMLADREAELLFRGQAYQRAIESYFQSNGRYPQQLQDLVRDPASPTRRHLRTLYGDPMSERSAKSKVRDPAGDWLLIEASDGGFSGVASRNSTRPLKKANFPTGMESFAEADSYSEWIFAYQPRRNPLPGRQPPFTPTPQPSLPEAPPSPPPRPLLPVPR
jgi:type II secretory pathway pseudopilin PulG